MKLGIMQPYFIPYIGYWQLMNAVDKYIVYDDVNFIKGGWINRNRILVNGEPKYFNIPMLGASPHKLINEVEVNHNEKLKNKNMRVIEGAYQKAPYYNEVKDLLEKIMNGEQKSISDFILNSFKIINEFEEFKKHGIDLKFLETGKIEYKQFHNEFQSNLSIIDVMMFNSKDKVKEFLNQYTLIEE